MNISRRKLTFSALAGALVLPMVGLAPLSALALSLIHISEPTRRM